MNTKMKFLFLSAFVLLEGKSALAGTEVCAAIGNELNRVKTTSLDPTRYQMRVVFSSGLNPWILPYFNALSVQFSQAYVYSKNLTQVAQANGCAPTPTQLNQSCQNILSVMPAVSQRFTSVHDTYASLVLSNNLPAALQYVPELFASEDNLQIAQNIFASACVPR